MAIRKNIYLTPGCFLNPTNKKIVVNVSSELVLNLIIQEIKSRYSSETQQEIFETNLKFIPDLSASEISQLKEIASPQPDTLVVVSCQMGKTEVDELELSLNVEVYFVMGDTKGHNHFMASEIQLWTDIWGGEERFMDLEDELGDEFFKSYEIQVIFDDETQSQVELEVSQTDEQPARLQFYPQLKRFCPTVDTLISNI